MRDTDRSVPTEGESKLLGSLEDIKQTEEAPCRLCDDSIDVSDAENWGDVFEALAEHGEESHEWDNQNGWSGGPGTPHAGGDDGDN
jgi:hypothetical protein